MSSSEAALPSLVALPFLLRYLPLVVGCAFLLAALGLGWRTWARRQIAPLWRCLLAERLLILWGIALVLVGLAFVASGIVWRVVWGGLLGVYVGWCLLSRGGGALWPAPPSAESLKDAERSGAANPIAGWVFPVLWAVVAVPLWFPEIRPQATVLALALVGASVLAVAILSGRFWPAEANAPAVAVLITTALISAWRGGVVALTVPKLTGLLLGLYGYWALRHWREAGASLSTLALWCGALTLGFAVVGLVGGLRPTKVGPLGDLLARAPKLVQSLPGTQHGRVSMNQLGGTILYTAPMLIALVTCRPGSRVGGERLSWLGWAVSLLGSAALVGVLLLTQSRSAWVGLLAALLVLLAGRAPWGLWALLAALAAGLVAWLIWGQAVIAPRLAQALVGPLPTSWGTVSLYGRLGIWEDAAGYILRNPWLGQGLGTFRLEGVQDLAGRSPIDVGLPHAHNVLLGVAYDLGLPGLAAYLGLLVVAAIDGVHALVRFKGPPRQVVLGALAGLVGAHVYGIMDAVALGAKPGVLFWMLLAVVSAAYRCYDEPPGRHPESA